LIHGQLKVGTANQRHPSHQQRFFSAHFKAKKKEQRQWQKQEQ
jgi:hypothetical protein